MMFSRSYGKELFMEEPKFEPVPEETAEAPAEPAALPAADEALIPELSLIHI